MMSQTRANLRSASGSANVKSVPNQGTASSSASPTPSSSKPGVSYSAAVSRSRDLGTNLQRIERAMAINLSVSVGPLTLSQALRMILASVLVACAYLTLVQGRKWFSVIGVSYGSVSSVLICLSTSTQLSPTARI